MKLIKQGAEAKLFLARHENQPVVIKERIKKNYRIEEIDEKLRKFRTSRESNLLSEARRIGVPTPKIIEVKEKTHEIIMEFIEGERLKEFLNHSDRRTIEKISFEVGKLIGKLHSAGIIHGDLTTSNMILRNNKIYFIDFGLGFFSKKIEDKATDLRLLHEALKSTHFEILDLCWDNIIKGYKEECSDVEEVLRRFEEIGKRVRYAKKS